jgi:cell division protease FtsH
VIAILYLPQLYQQNLSKREISYTEFQQILILPKLSPDKPISISIQDNLIEGKLPSGNKIVTYGPVSESLQKKLEEQNIPVSYLPPKQPSILFTIFMSILPILLIAGLLIFLIGKGSKGGISSSFGKSPAKLVVENPNVSFAEVAGVDEAKEELIEIVDFLRDPSSFTQLGGKIPKGVLLVGNPGVGKTLLARAVASEAKVPFFTVSGSNFIEMFVGVGASRVRDLFDQAKKQAPCIVFIDEIDAVGRHRGSGHGGGHDEREQTLNQLLVEMDGFEDNQGVIVMAATNRVDVLDSALLRPGRFDRQVYVPTPDLKGREEILKVHARKIPLASDVNLSTIAKGTPGFSGADLQNLLNEAALIGARLKARKINSEHLDQAKDKVMMGPARKAVIMSEFERKTTAFHEIGHALVGWFTKGADPVHKVTIVPRGKALGVTMLLPSEDKFTYSKEQALALIDYALGGRAAEEIVFGHFTTGASDDIKKATSLARRMVCEWGMSELGPLDLASDYHKSEDLSKQIDKAVSNIISAAYNRTTRLLLSHQGLLEKLSLALLEKETLLHDDMKIAIEEFYPQ